MCKCVSAHTTLLHWTLYLCCLFFRSCSCSDEAIVDDVGTTGPLMAAVDDSDRASESADAAESLVSCCVV